MSAHEQELSRIREAYADRDRASSTAAAWADPAYRTYLQWLEWRLLDMLTRSGVPLAGARVLEVGCGSGYFAHRFLEYGAAHVAGIDLMENRIREARRRYPLLELEAGDAGALPWPDASFQLVTQFTCLSSILEPAVRTRVAGEMWRVLAPGGGVLSFDMVRAHPALRALRRARTGKAASAGPTATTPIELDELARLFPDATGRPRVSGLSMDAAGLARRQRGLAAALAALPVLRTHVLYVARK